MFFFFVMNITPQANHHIRGIMELQRDIGLRNILFVISNVGGPRINNWEKMNSNDIGTMESTKH